MENRYSKKTIESTEGPSELTIKRILAFSKALKSSKDKKKNSLKGPKEI